MSGQVIYSICAMCNIRCPIQVYVKNNNCKLIQGNLKANGINGALCARGTSGLSLLANRNRLQFPLLRQGKRGEGKWTRISWNEALDLAAQKIRQISSQHGGKSILWSDCGGPHIDLRQAFCQALDSPNFTTTESIYAANTCHAALSLFGFNYDQLIYDYRQANVIVFQSFNPFESINIKEVNDLLDSIKTGTKLTVIDVRASISANKASRFLMIRPNTDYALNLAIINVLLSENLFNVEFVKNWIKSKDLEALKLFVTPYTPDFAQAETSIKAEEIISLARELAQAAPAVIWHSGINTSRYNDSFYVVRSAYIINILLGSIGAKGGLPLLVQPRHLHRQGLRRFSDLFLKPNQPRADGVGSTLPHLAKGPGLLHLAYNAIANNAYPIKSYIVYNHDPLKNYPEADKLKKILNRLDFLICITTSWTNIAWQADLILPLSTYLERESILSQKNNLKPSFFMHARCLTPCFDTKPDWEIITNLAARLDISKLAFKKIEDIWEWQLKGTNIKITDLQKNGFVELANKPIFRSMQSYKFPTISTKIELFNPEWESKGIASLSLYNKKSPLPRGLFQLTLGNCALHINSYNELLCELMPENELWINYEIAHRMGIHDGNTIEIKSNGHSALIKAHVSKFIHPEAVFMVRGFGGEDNQILKNQRSSYGLAETELMPNGLNKIDKAGGGIAFQEYIVHVKRYLSSVPKISMV